MADGADRRQKAFHFVPARGEVMNFARLGFPLDWRRIGRRASRLVILHLQGALPEHQAQLPVSGFEVRRHFLEVALFEEIRLHSKQKARALKKQARIRQGRHLPGSLFLACTSEGHHMQRIIDDLERRISEREAALLCG